MIPSKNGQKSNSCCALGKATEAMYGCTVVDTSETFLPDAIIARIEAANLGLLLGFHALLQTEGMQQLRRIFHLRPR